MMTNVEFKKTEWTVFLGLLLNVFGSCLTAGAFVVQKLTHNEKSESHYCCQWQWWVGFSMLLSAGCLEGISLMFAPLSIVAPLSGLTVLLNTIFAVIFLKEPFRWLEGVIVALLAVGIGFTSTFGPHSELADSSSDNLKGLLFEDRMTYYYVCVFVVVGLFATFVLSYTHCHHMKRLHAFGYAASAATFGGQQNMFLKCAFLQLKNMFDGIPEYKHYFFYLCLWFILIFGIAQIMSLNCGLKEHEAVGYIPIYQACLVVSGVVAGGWYFKEFSGLAGEQFVGFCAGNGLIVAGIVLLTLLPQPPKEETGDDADTIAEKEELLPIKDPAAAPLQSRADKQKPGCCR